MQNWVEKIANIELHLEFGYTHCRDRSHNFPYRLACGGGGGVGGRAPSLPLDYCHNLCSELHQGIFFNGEALEENPTEEKRMK